MTLLAYAVNLGVNGYLGNKEWTKYMHQYQNAPGIAKLIEEKKKVVGNLEKIVEIDKKIQREISSNPSLIKMQENVNKYIGRVFFPFPYLKIFKL